MELLLVVTIIGIAAAYAIPQYQQYTVRSRVIEGLTLADGAKMCVWDTLATGNPQGLPAGYAVGFVSPGPTANVAGVALNGATGAITIQYTPAAGGGTLVLNPYVGGVAAATPLPVGTAPFAPPVLEISWQCAAAGATIIPGSGGIVGTTLPQNAPSSCR